MFGKLDEDRARGLMLGLLLGDAHAEQSIDGPLHGTCLAQLACFTLEGTIRASQRFAHKGICHPPSVVWHAWCRWAHLQGISATFEETWASGTTSWPDGWLVQVRPLSERRGSAPATVAALLRSSNVPETQNATSAGHHALTRTLPIALFASTVGDLDAFAGELAALTHGPDTVGPTIAGTRLAAQLIHGEPQTPEAIEFASHAPAGTAAHALAHGYEAAVSARELDDALAMASPHGRGAATVAGALFGAANGIGSLPQWAVSRLEIGWVADRLARDAFAEVTSSPGGTEYTAADDPTWWGRYPGW